MQKANVSKLVFRCMAVSVIFGALVLVGCPGDDDRETRPVDNVNVPLTQANATALNGETFTFTTGVTEFGTATSTDVAFTTAAGVTNADITSGASSANPTTQFGSCTFPNDPASTFATGPLAPGSQAVFIQLCSVEIDAGDVPVGGTTDGSAVLILNGRRSEPETVEVGLNANGDLTVNGTTTGFTISPTGATGSTGN